MAVMIRLSRQGAKKNPQYLVVAVDSAKKRDGAYLANLGHYSPSKSYRKR
jgi:small subunit ribosomal protein S16